MEIFNIISKKLRKTKTININFAFDIENICNYQEHVKYFMHDLDSS